MRFFDRMRGSLIAAPTRLLPVMKMPLRETVEEKSATARQRRQATSADGLGDPDPPKRRRVMGKGGTGGR